MKIEIRPYTLKFKQPAGTSRGVYRTRKVWYLIAHHEGKTGIGECAPLPDLSCERGSNYEMQLERLVGITAVRASIDYELLRDYPSVLFGLETAFMNLGKENFRLMETPFTLGKESIEINGLVWMGTYDEMLMRIEEKKREGFRCIKLKIGAIDFGKEIELIRHIREAFSAKDIEIRVDANGGFTAKDAPMRLEELARYDIHSIEQPIKANQWLEMAELCERKALPIALDEELIGINSKRQKELMLDTIKPQYIILKPSLHGGLKGAEEWMRLADERGIGYWTTSALESNIGLNAIAQWTSAQRHAMPQGLGTGRLFENNFDMPLDIKGGHMEIDFGRMPSTEDFINWINNIENK